LAALDEHVTTQGPADTAADQGDARVDQGEGHVDEDEVRDGEPAGE
jgi:hypothetical protein